MAENLLPCPFCGGPAKTMRYNGTAQATCAGDYVECAGADILSPVAMWNRRPAPMEAVAWREKVSDAVLDACRQYADISRAYAGNRLAVHTGYILSEAADAIQALAVIPTQGLSSSSPKSEDTHRAAETAVVGWQPIDTAPKDAVLLLFGQIGYGRNDGHPSGPIRACGYWDEIDSAWAFTDTTWEGPFMEPTHWMTLPEEPGKTS